MDQYLAIHDRIIIISNYLFKMIHLANSLKVLIVDNSQFLLKENQNK